MTRFGKLIVVLLLLGVLGIGSMLRFGGGSTMRGPAAVPRAAVPRPVVVARAVRGPGALAMPVAGVPPTALTDTFTQARGEDRVHDAIDIMAARGTAVLAAAGGTVEKIFESKLGGHTVYIRSPDRRWSYYYAHLDHYADDLREGLYVPAGRVIAAVGSTGDANAEGPHLHFEVKRMAPDEKWYQGHDVNPYPLLTGR